MKENSGIIRNRGKVESAVHNAQVARQVQSEYGSLAAFLWSLVPEGKPISNNVRCVSKSRLISLLFPLCMNTGC